MDKLSARALIRLGDEVLTVQQRGERLEELYRRRPIVERKLSEQWRTVHPNYGPVKLLDFEEIPRLEYGVKLGSVSITLFTKSKELGIRSVDNPNALRVTIDPADLFKIDAPLREIYASLIDQVPE